MLGVTGSSGSWPPPPASAQTGAGHASCSPFSAAQGDPCDLFLQEISRRDTDPGAIPSLVEGVAAGGGAGNKSWGGGHQAGMLLLAG